MRRFAAPAFAIVLIGTFAFVYLQTRPSQSDSLTEGQVAAIPTPYGTTTQSYSILSIKDVSTWTLEKNSKPVRKAFQVSIYAPVAKSFEERGQMVVVACRSILVEREAQVVQVWLEPNESTRGLGFVLAMATYSPDGKGMSGTENGAIWTDVSATDYQLNPKALAMTKTSPLAGISMEQARIISSRRPFTPR